MVDYITDPYDEEEEERDSFLSVADVDWGAAEELYNSEIADPVPEPVEAPAPVEAESLSASEIDWEAAEAAYPDEYTELPTDQGVRESQYLTQTVDPDVRGEALQLVEHDRKWKGIPFPVEEYERDLSRYQVQKRDEDVDRLDLDRAPVLKKSLTDPVDSPLFKGDEEKMVEHESWLMDKGSKLLIHFGKRLAIGKMQIDLNVDRYRDKYNPMSEAEESNYLARKQAVELLSKDREIAIAQTGVKAVDAAANFVWNSPGMIMEVIGQQYGFVSDFGQNLWDGSLPEKIINREDLKPADWNLLYQAYRGPRQTVNTLMAGFGGELDLDNIKTPDGKPLDDETQRGMMIAHGSFSIAVEAIDTFGVYKAGTFLFKKPAKKVTTEWLKRNAAENKQVRQLLAKIGALSATGTATNAIEETLQELSALFWEDQAREYAGQKGIPAAEKKSRVADAARAGAQMGWIMPLPVAPFIYSNVKKQITASNEMQEFADKMAGVAEDSKLLNRFPERFQQYVKDTLKTYGVNEHFTMPVEQFQAYLDEAGLDIDTLDGQLPGIKESFEKAAEGDGQVRIAGDKYGQTFARDEVFRASYEKFVKYHERVPSKQEVEVLRESIKQTAADAKAVRAKPEFKAEVDFWKEQLADLGTGDTITAWSEQLASFYLTQGQREGLSRAELEEMFRLRAREEGVAAAELTSLVTAIQTDQIPTEEQARGQSLQNFVQQFDDTYGAESKAAAVEAGYFDEQDPTALSDTAFKDAVNQTEPRYAYGAEQERVVERREQIAALQQEAQEMGVDLTEGTPAEIAERLAAGRLEQPFTVLEEGAGPDALSDRRISTRFPTAVARTEDPTTTRLEVDLESSKQAEAAFEKNSALFKDYPGFKTRKRKSDAVVEDYLDFVVDNLVWVYDQVAPDVRERSKLWYDGAQQIAMTWSDRYGKDPFVTSGVLAALSPQKDWFQNVSLAERVFDVMEMAEETDVAIGEEHRKRAYEIFSNEKGVINPKNKTYIDRVIGVPFSELTIPHEKAVYIRLYDEINLPRGYRVVSPEGSFVGEPGGKVAWGSLAEIGKAVKIYESETLAEVNALMGDSAHKIRNFYNNIVAPQHGVDVTIDTHAVAAGLVRPLSAKSVEVLQNFGTVKGVARSALTGTSGTYGVNAEAYRRAAEKRGVLPREMQSITWEAIRGLFSDTYKRTESGKAKSDPEGLTEVDKLWKMYENGEITLDQARRRIVDHAGGFTNPDWYRPDSPGPARDRGTSYEKKLPGPGIPQRGADPVDGGTGTGAAAGPSRLYKGGEAGARGYIDISPARDYFRITLTSQANLSTFLHESGHFFLEAITSLANRDGASEQLTQDLQTIKNWLGWEEGQTWFTKEQHEQFARGYEAYLMEGKAPSKVLISAFRRFSAWLKQIYTGMDELDVDLSDEVRGVMDRMLASDQAIAQMQDVYDIRAMFDSADQAGMTDEEFAKYQKNFEDAMAESEEELRTRIMDEVAVQKRKIYNDAKRELRTQITALVNARPVYRAAHYLRTGQMLDESEVPPSLGKLDRQTVKDLYPNDSRIVSRLPRGATVKENGASPKLVAQHFGFDTPQAMIDALLAAKPKDQVIREEVQDALDETFGDSLTDESIIGEEAARALHSPKIEGVIVEELKRLSLKMGISLPKGFTRQVQIMADEQVSMMPLTDLRSGYSHMVTEQRYAKMALEAAAKGNWAEAVEYKKKQLMNHWLYRKVNSTKADIDKGYNYLKRIQKTTTQRKIGKAGGSYLESINQLLERIELKKVSKVELARRSQKGLLDHLDTINKDGQVVELAKEFLKDLTVTNYAELTFEEFSVLVDSVKNIEQAARRKLKYDNEVDQMEFRQAVIQVVSSFRANIKEVKKSKKQNRADWEKATAAMRAGDSERLKTEFIFVQADGGVYGQVQRLMFEPLARAQADYMDKAAKLAETLLAPDKRITGAQGRRLAQEYNFLGTPMKGHEVLAVLLNMGNESNLKKLIEGYSDRNWTEETLIEAIEQILTKEDIELAQHIWDEVNQFWPEIEQLAKDVVGKAPPKVEAKPLTVGGVKLKGGYYPVVYDPLRSDIAKRNYEGQEVDFFEANLLRMNISAGFNEARVDVSDPLLLDLGVLQNHFQEVLFYLTHYKAVNSVGRLLMNKDVRSAFEDVMGPEYYKDTKLWLKHIANQGQTQDESVRAQKFFDRMAIGTSIVAMAGGTSTAIVQILGLATTLGKLGPRYFMEGFFGTMTPAKWKNAWEKSNELRHITKTFDRDARKIAGDLLLQLKREGRISNARAKAVQLGFGVIGHVQMLVSGFTWIGAYEKGIKQHDMTEHDAAMYADQIMRTSQSAGALKDLAKVQRAPGFGRVFTSFYGYFSALYGLLRQAGRDLPRQPIKSTAQLISYIVLPVMIEQVMREGMPEEGEEEEWLRDAGIKALTYVAGVFPVMRNAVSGAATDYSYEMAPTGQIIGRGIKSGAAMAKDFREDEEISSRDVQNMIKLISAYYHVPVRPFIDGWRYVDEYLTGELDEPVRELFFGVKK